MDINVDYAREFIQSLDTKTLARVLRTIDLLEIFGNKLGMPHSKPISRALFELRIRGRTEVRLIYCFYNKQAFILSGFIKKTEKLPPRELAKAQIVYKRLTGYNL